MQHDAKLYSYVKWKLQPHFENRKWRAFLKNTQIYVMSEQMASALYGVRKPRKQATGFLSSSVRVLAGG